VYQSFYLGIAFLVIEFLGVALIFKEKLRRKESFLPQIIVTVIILIITIRYLIWFKPH
jgi:hypothetical protein